jgi:predicted RecB family nuclease
VRHQARAARAPAILARMRDLHRDLGVGGAAGLIRTSLKAVREAARLPLEPSRCERRAVDVLVLELAQVGRARAASTHAVEYNADDCRATRALKDWLAEGPGAPFETENDEPAALSRRARSPV